MARKINASLVKIIILLIIAIIFSYFEYISTFDGYILHNEYTYNISNKFSIINTLIPMSIYKIILGALMAMSGVAFHSLIRKEDSYNKKKGTYYSIDKKILFILFMYISVLLRVSEISLFIVNIITSFFTMIIFIFTRRGIYKVFGNKRYIKIFYYTLIINSIGNLIFLVKNILSVKFNQKLLRIFASNDLCIKEIKYLLIVFPFIIILCGIIIYKYLIISKYNTNEKFILKVAKRNMCEFGICSVILSLGVVSIGGMVFFIGLVVPHFCRYLFENSRKAYLLGTAICGGILYMVADLVSIYSIFEIKIIVPLICMPYIIFILYKIIFE